LTAVLDMDGSEGEFKTGETHVHIIFAQTANNLLYIRKKQLGIVVADYEMDSISPSRMFKEFAQRFKELRVCRRHRGHLVDCNILCDVVWVGSAVGGFYEIESIAVEDEINGIGKRRCLEV